MTPSKFRGFITKRFRIFEPPPDVNVWQWAEAYRTLSRDVTALPGRYATDEAPYQREPQEAFLDPDVQVTVLYWASRTGKTEMIVNLQGYIIDIDPSSILMVYPTIDSAKKWSQKFFSPMTRATPRLRGKIKDNRRKDSENTILSKRYPGGTITSIGSNSTTGFRQVQCRVVCCDEIDDYEMTPEGDPVALASRRCDNYPNSIEVRSSTPTVRGFSRIEKQYNSSDKRRWFVTCPHCKEEYYWRLFDDDGDLRDLVIPDDDPRKAHLRCPKCKGSISDKQRLRMLERGRWAATAPFSGIRGYWLDGLSSPFPAKKGFKTRLHQLASEWIEAKKAGPGDVQTFMNTAGAVTYEERGDTYEAEPILKRREKYEVPEGVVFISDGVDVQKNRLEAERVGWGAGNESWGMEYKIFEGDTARPTVWNELAEWLETPVEHPTKGLMTSGRVFVDSGAYTRTVYAFCRGRPKVFPVKGQGGAAKVPVTRPAGRDRLVSIAVDHYKELIYGRLEILEGPGLMHWNHCYDIEYFKQITAEKAVWTTKKGIRVRQWRKLRERNEALDIRVYATAALDMLPRVNLERMAKASRKRERAAPLPEEDAIPTTIEEIRRKPGRPRRKVGNWAYSWK